MRIAALLAALMACAVAWPAGARADGDPASDILIDAKVFYPYQQKFPKAVTAGLETHVANAAKKGYRVRVAMIADEFDLGSAGMLFKHPQDYSKFLAQELAQFNTDWVLIAMPNGYGIYKCVGMKREGGYVDPCEKEEPSAADKRALRELGAPGRDLAGGADKAVAALAALHGASVGGPSMLLPIAGIVVAAALAGGGVMLAMRRSQLRRAASSS